MCAERRKPDSGYRAPYTSATEPFSFRMLISIIAPLPDQYPTDIP